MRLVNTGRALRFVLVVGCLVVIAPPTSAGLPIPGSDGGMATSGFLDFPVSSPPGGPDPHEAPLPAPSPAAPGEPGALPSPGGPPRVPAPGSLPAVPRGDALPSGPRRGSEPGEPGRNGGSAAVAPVTPAVSASVCLSKPPAGGPALPVAFPCGGRDPVPSDPGGEARMPAADGASEPGGAPFRPRATGPEARVVDLRGVTEGAGPAPWSVPGPVVSPQPAAGSHEAEPVESPRPGSFGALAAWVLHRMGTPGGWLAFVLTGAFVLSIPFWLLYRRLAPSEVLALPLRRTIFDRVRAQPGITAGGLARALGVARRTARHHLDVLREFGHVEARTIGKRMHYFENGGRYTRREKTERLAFSTPRARRIFDALVDRPDASLRGIARETGLPKSTVQWHVDRLRGLGLVDADGSPRADPASRTSRAGGTGSAEEGGSADWPRPQRSHQ